MGSYPHIHRAETTGRWLGGVVRRVIRGEGRVNRVGRPPVIARIMLWTVGVAILGLLLIVAFWVALLLVLAWIGLKAVQVGGSSNTSEIELTDPHDHRQSLFYHPLSYNDDPDPRFPDPRYDR